MNERIRELEIEAIAYADSKVPQVHRYNDIYYNIVHVKFAELIVKECMSVCKSRVGNSDYNTGRMHCVSDIKEHFGVEE